MSILRCYSKKEWLALGVGAWNRCPTCEGTGDTFGAELGPEPTATEGES